MATKDAEPSRKKSLNFMSNLFSRSSTGLSDLQSSGQKSQIIELSDSEVSPLSPDNSSISIKPYFDEVDQKLQSVPSIQSFLNKDFTLITHRQQRDPLLEGPRRLLRLCVFVLIAPVVLISVPLYAKLVLNPPQDYPMAPTDQRHFRTPISSFWCEGQAVTMDSGTFNAYLLHNPIKAEMIRKNFTMLQHLTLKDDVKEYWGFYYNKGSIITLSSCTRYDGGQLMILRGSKNLHKCAWIGESDSSEEIIDPLVDGVDELNITTGEPHGGVQNESEQTDEDTADYNGDVNWKDLNPALDKNFVESHSTHFKNAQNIKNEESTEPRPVEERSTTPVPSSTDRVSELERIISEGIKLSKSKSELFKIIHRLGKGTYYSKEDILDHNENVRLSTKEFYLDDEDRSTLSKYKSFEENHNLPVSENKIRKPRSLDSVDLYDDNEEEEIFGKIDPFKLHKQNNENNTAEDQLGSSWVIPKGLKIDRGVFNQTNEHDTSLEEYRSSYSSSEEKLASCKGVILSLPLVSDYRCQDFTHLQRNQISYKIPISGVYYFVFSSDNEVFVNDLYFNLTMQKVVYDTEPLFNNSSCINSTKCSLPLSFWSDDQTVVEVMSDGNWAKSYRLEMSCEPRVFIYMTSLILVPIFILFCALR